MGRIPGGDIYEVHSRRPGPPRILEREPELYDGGYNRRPSSLDVYPTRYRPAAPVTEVKSHGKRTRVVISSAKEGAAGAGPARVPYPRPIPTAYGDDNEYGLGLSAPRVPSVRRERFRPARPPSRSPSVEVIRLGRRRSETRLVREDGTEASIPGPRPPPARRVEGDDVVEVIEESDVGRKFKLDSEVDSDGDSEIYLPQALEQHGISDPSFETSSDSVPPKEGLQPTSLLRPAQDHAVYNSTWVGSVFDDSEICAHLKTLSTPPGSSFKPIIQWQHLERPLMKFDEFMAASQIALSLSEPDKKHVRDLLRRAQRNYEKQRQYGRDLEPVCVGDVDYTDDGRDPEKRTASACFFSLPFFSLQRYDVGGIRSLPPGSDEHPARPLVQMQTRSLSERRELAQAICQLPSTPKGQLLHVSQVWCLVVNDDTLLTCSPASAKQIQGQSIAIDQLKQSFREEKSVLIRGNSEVQLQLPLKDVQSWLELVAPFADEVTDFVGEFAEAEFLHKGQRVTSTNWPSITETANSFPIQLTFNYPSSDWSRFEPGIVKAAQHLVFASAHSALGANETAPQIFYYGCNGSLEALKQIADALHQSLVDGKNESQKEQYGSCPEASLTSLQEWLQASQATTNPDQTRRSKSTLQLKESREKIAVMAMYMHLFFWPADFQHPIINKFLGGVMSALEGEGFLVENDLTLSSGLAVDFDRLLSHKAFKAAHKLASAFHGHETRFYPLPPSFYKAWLRLLTIFIQLHHFKQTKKGNVPRDNNWYGAFNHVWEDLRSGEKALTLRLRRNIQLEDYQVCPPAGIAALMMKHFGPNLLSQAHKPSSTSTSASPTIPQIYTDIFLAFEATLIETPLDRSHQTTLRHLQQEFAAILSVLKAQLQILQTFQSNLDEQNRTSSFRSIPQAFRSDEGESRMASVMGSSEAAIAAGIDTFRSLQGRATELGEWQLAEMDTNKDRQEGAILVFTIVTIVFLPLSFVSSVLGMNTSDIRDMNLNQWVYWASAIPLTILVVGGSLWWVGAFEDLGRWFGKSSSLNVSEGRAEFQDEKMVVDRRRLQGSSGRERYADVARPVMRRTTYPHREDYV